MSLLYDIMHSTNKELIKKEVERHYDKNLYNRFVQVFEQLKKIQVSDVKMSQFIIFIKVYRFNEEEDIYLEEFDHNEPDLLFDVCAMNVSCEDEEIYSILGMDYFMLLGCSISNDTLEKFSPEQIVTHVIWSMDW